MFSMGERALDPKFTPTLGLKVFTKFGLDLFRVLFLMNDFLFYVQFRLILFDDEINITRYFLLESRLRTRILEPILLWMITLLKVLLLWQRILLPIWVSVVELFAVWVFWMGLVLVGALLMVLFVRFSCLFCLVISEDRVPRIKVREVLARFSVRKLRILMVLIGKRLWGNRLI